MGIGTPSGKDDLHERLSSVCDEQTQRFAKAGLTMSALAPIIAREFRIIKGLEPGRSKDDVMVYLAPSDSLRNLRNHNLAGLSVLTVAGSGDFPQTFMDAGSREVDVFDFSVTACFLTELKLIASQALTFEEYMCLFPPIDPAQKCPLFDPIAYKRLQPKLKPYLTPQAKEYLSALMKPAYEQLFIYTPNPEDPLSAVRYMATSTGQRRNRQDPPYLRDKQSFEQLQSKMSAVPYSITYGDINNMAVEVSKYDFVYISNIGFNFDKTIGLAADLLRRGARRVGFTWRFIGFLNEDFAVDSEHAVDCATGEVMKSAAAKTDKIGPCLK